MKNPFELILEKLANIEKLLQQLSINNSNMLNNLPEVLNLKQAIELVGIAKPTMYIYTSKRLIPHFKKGKKLYFRRTELIEWLFKSKVKTINEVEQEANNYVIKNKNPTL